MKTTHRLLIFLLFYFVVLSPAWALPKDNLDTTYTEIPITFVLNMPVIEVKINNHPVKLIVDMGTTGVDAMLSSAILSQAAATYEGIAPGKHFTNYLGQKFQYKKYQIQTLTIGTFNLHHLIATELPGINFFSDKPDSIPAVLNNGTLGVEVLKRFSVIIDYPNHKILFIKSNHYPNEYKIKKWHSIPFYEGKSGNVLSNAVVNIIKVSAIWDTGNNAATISEKVANQLTNKKICKHDKANLNAK